MFVQLVDVPGSWKSCPTTGHCPHFCRQRIQEKNNISISTPDLPITLNEMTTTTYRFFLRAIVLPVPRQFENRNLETSSEENSVRPGVLGFGSTVVCVNNWGEIHLKHPSARIEKYSANHFLSPCDWCAHFFFGLKRKLLKQSTTKKNLVRILKEILIAAHSQASSLSFEVIFGQI
jgi:hypothetical protein